MVMSAEVKEFEQFDFACGGRQGGREPGRQGDGRVTGDGRVEGGKREIPFIKRCKKM